MTVRTFNLVAPLAKATDMRITDTAGLVARNRSGAVSLLTDCSGRQGDVDSANKRSTPATQTTPGIRISKMAIRTTTTRVPSSACVPSADQSLRHHADFSFSQLDLPLDEVVEKNLVTQFKYPSISKKKQLSLDRKAFIFWLNITKVHAKPGELILQGDPSNGTWIDSWLIPQTRAGILERLGGLASVW